MKLIVYYDIKKSKFRTIRGIAPDGFILSYPTDYYNDSITIFPEEVVPDNYLDNLVEIGNQKEFLFCEEVNITTGDGKAKIDYKALPYNDSKETLEDFLDKAVAEEDYEKAAKIRDKINKLKK